MMTRGGSSSAVARAAQLVLLGLGGSCAYQPMPTQPRPVLPPVAAARDTEPDAMPQLVQFVDHGAGRASGKLQGSGETVEFECWRQPPGGPPRPVVLVVPILAGGAELMEQVARRMFDHGFDVAYCARAGSALKPPQRGAELQELFRRTVLHQRLLLAWLRSPGHAPSNGVFALGLSMGGMVATVLAAVEPGLDAITICLSGGDLASMVGISSEQRVQSWVQWRHREDGVGADHLQWELQNHLRLEPIVLAAAVPADKVLFVSALFDTVVPAHNQDLLWEALGRPMRLFVPLGHYSAALAIDPILSAASQHFRERLPAAPAELR